MMKLKSCNGNDGAYFTGDWSLTHKKESGSSGFFLSNNIFYSGNSKIF